MGDPDEEYLKDETIAEAVSVLRHRLIRKFIDPDKGITLDKDGNLTIHGITDELVKEKVSNKSFQEKTSISLRPT